MGEMVAAGKVRAIGVSEVTIAELDAAHRTHPLAGVQYLPGPDRIDQLEEDVGAAAVVLDGEALAALDVLPPPVS